MTNKTTESLHDQIMRLPCTPPKDANVNQSISYKSGHRDARHAAAELAAEHEAEQQQELTAIEAMARMLADGEWAEHVGELGGPIAQRLETEITRMHNEEQAAPVAVPDGWRLVPKKITPQMIEGAMAAHYGTRRLRQAGGPGGVDMTVNCINYNGTQAMKRMWAGALSAAPTPPAGPWESPCTPPAQPLTWGAYVNGDLITGNRDYVQRERDEYESDDPDIEHEVAFPLYAAPPAPEQADMKVPRELIERIAIAESQGDGLTLREAIDELRALLGGGA